ncbi:MAG: hypothetical protein L6R42_007683 [Xanthoria sp. 1 TBL-2021]|nr:MAG: hypothetical protein L6R42_007683 [Xanthoria sp. 1 TBL-2021]
MGKKRKHLSHEEIWDDSALVDSWDLALQEYQLYHSIHARGERVEDVLREAEDPEDLPKDEKADMDNMTSELMDGVPHTQEPEDGEVEDGEVEDDSPVDNGAMHETMRVKDEIPAAEEHFPPPPAVEDRPQSVPEASDVPSVLVNGGESADPPVSGEEALLIRAALQDEGLKNLMMSWYYAGYYTGLYEGRKQSDDAAPRPSSNKQSRP